MYLEQQLRECPACHVVFAVEYEFLPASPPKPREGLSIRSVVCPVPECNHIVPVPLARSAVRVRAKRSFVPQPRRQLATPHALHLP